MSQELAARVAATVRTIPNFPKPNIQFKDITPIFLNPTLIQEIIQDFVTAAKAKNLQIDAVLGVESRGFLLGPALAMALNVPFILVRKRGKLPGNTLTASYDLEYGSATIEMHQSDLPKGSRVLVHDDLLATGGTAAAVGDLVQKAGASVEAFFFLIHLTYLEGFERIEKYSDKVYATLDVE